MKLLRCDKCKDVFLIPHINQGKPGWRMCICGAQAGKYLSDGITAVVTKDSILIGIDNNTFGFSMRAMEYWKNEEDYKDKRLDFFFVGWIPTLPGEVIFVDSVEEVINYNFEEKYTHTSTNPTTHIWESFSIVRTIKRIFKKGD